jgi:two-component system, OmpR family, alkaline phosphatase synthesis response regulator PhoP
MPKKILIADDEDNIRRLVRLSLEDDGYELFEASDGSEALQKAREIKPDLIVLDVMMPGLIGYRVCEEVKRNRETAHAYVLFLSARDSKSSESACLDAGGDRLMSKPFDPDELSEVVKKILG